MARRRSVVAVVAGAVAFAGLVAGCDRKTPAGGRPQARFLAGAVAGRAGGVVMLNGAPADPNAVEYRRGAAGELRRLGVAVASEVSVEGWNPNRARAEMARALARRGTAGISGVYVANDAMA